MNKTMEHNTTYTVVGSRQEAPGVVTLVLRTEESVPLAFIPGQFITVYFPDTGTPEGKAYSISSAPGDDTFTITVRGIGEFSHRLCALGAGDTVTASLPYGFFAPEYTDSHVIMLAAGIGITPFRSMIEDAAVHTPDRMLTLLHSARNVHDALFAEELKALPLSKLTTQYFLTRESSNVPGTLHRRMTADDVLPHIQKDTQTEILICGPISFTRDLWRALRARGIPEDTIYTEAFFS